MVTSDSVHTAESGPDLITAIINLLSFRLALHAVYKIPNLFHKSLLKKFEDSGTPLPTPPPLVLVDGSLAFEVSRIIDFRVVHHSLQYLVHWWSYGFEEMTWYQHLIFMWSAYTGLSIAIILTDLILRVLRPMVEGELKQQSSESTEAKPQLNPAATSFYPGTSHPFTPGSPYAPGASRVVMATSGEKSDMSEFARFMVSRELINTSLTKFDDRAESYRAWKATFKAAIANLNFTAEQELDLLIKWLGPGSTNRIKSLRTVYVGQAEAGLAAAWQRLERTFGSAEAIEKALFKRLQDIPKINLKEVHKLQDLNDLLMELELAKRDPRLSGLCYLDTAHGVNPIVVKLPYSLQEKWATSVSRYKRMHDVTFPPFIQFCKFIDEQLNRIPYCWFIIIHEVFQLYTYRDVLFQ
ncbi:uncharacterized protein ACNLHF_022640 [Anomaloglossus baeobatrachus]